MHIIKQSTKSIKPATRTPSTLGRYKLGFIDENAPATNINVVLFFSCGRDLNANFVSQLEKSLEKALTRFYPLAGRYLKEIHIVDCSDQGVEFIQAKVNVKVADIVGSEVNLRLFDEFIPSAIGAVDQVTDPMLSVQVTTFECGGLALGVSFSHRVVDASSVCTILNNWASISRGENEGGLIGPGFNSSSFFPSRGIPPFVHGFPRSKDDAERNFLTKKLSFNDNEIAKLREKITNGRSDGQKWSNVILVSALIWKTFKEIDQRTHGYSRTSFFCWPINLRGKTASSIPKDSCGNFSGILVTQCDTIETTIEALADLLRDTLKNFIHDYSKVCHDNEKMQTLAMNSLSQIHSIPPTGHKIVLTSLCKFPFYEADFGFGKPVWVNRGSALRKNAGYLMDGVGGKGIEACLGIEDEHIPYFDQIKAFAG